MTIPHEIEAVALLGWRVYPASRMSKAGRFKGASAEATYDLNTIARWCREYGQSNWRVVMNGSNIWALDIDAPDTHGTDGITALKQLVEANGPLPERPMTRSGGGGYGMFFAHTDEKIVGKTGTPAPGIDPRRGNLSITIPPSIHVTTKRPYVWVTPPWKVSPPKAPEWLLKLVEPPPEPTYRQPHIDTSDAARNRLYRAASAVMASGDGNRNATLNARSFQVGRLIGAGLLGQQEAVEALYGAARSIGLEHHEIKATIQSGIKAGMAKPWENQP